MPAAGRGIVVARRNVWRGPETERVRGLLEPPSLAVVERGDAAELAVDRVVEERR